MEEQVYDYDDIDMDKKISDINKSLNSYQKEIFKILFKISKSFANTKIKKKDRDEMFLQIDELKSNVKICSKKLRDINNIKKKVNNQDEKENQKNIKKVEFGIQNIEEDLGKIKKDTKDLERKIIPLYLKNNSINANIKKNNQLMVIKNKDKNIFLRFFEKFSRIFSK